MTWLSVRCFALCFFVSANLLAIEKKLAPLFVIKRSVNLNEVVYEARLVPDGFDARDPIHIYWRMNAKGGAIEPLSAIERQRAYGVTIKKVTKSEVIFALKALPNQRVTIRKKNTEGKERVLATTEIDGEESEIDHIFVQIEGNGLLPKITFTELHGRSIKSGESMSERIPGK